MQKLQKVLAGLGLSNKRFYVIIFAIWGKMGEGKINGDLFPFFHPERRIHL